MTAQARWALREATTPEHERLDAAFGRFDLSDPQDYRDFLLAHRRALPPLERAVAASGAPWSGWSPRAGLLDDDLRRLGAELGPLPESTPALTAAQSWGVQYVLEGSRLGGRMLATRTPAGAANAYLAAAFAPGGWAKFQSELDDGLTALGPGALDAAQASARAAFARFQSMVTPPGDPPAA